jgi:Protein of unknown function (DUF2442)
MSIVENVEPRIQNVKVTSDAIVAYLVDGRVLSVPLVWSWRLSEATAKQRGRFELIGDGQGVHWPEIDEDISVEGMLHGARIGSLLMSSSWSRPSISEMSSRTRSGARGVSVWRQQSRNFSISRSIGTGRV